MGENFLGGKKFLVALILLCSFSLGAFGQGAGFSTGTQKVFLDGGESTIIMLDFFNDSVFALKTAVSLNFDREGLIASPLKKTFELNSGERTFFSVDLKALENAQAGEYKLNIVSDFSQQGTVSKQLDITVGGAPEILFQPLRGQSSCLGDYSDTFDVVLKNNSGTLREFSLFSADQVFLPEFEAKTVSLVPFVEKTVKVKLNFDIFSDLGPQSVLLGAKSADGTEVLRELGFEIVDCTDNQKPFSISAATSGFSMDKFRKNRVPFTITNNKSVPQEIFFSAQSTLGITQGQFSFTLGPFKPQKSFFEIETRGNDAAEEHLIELIAWSRFGKEKKTFLVQVRKTSNVSAVLLNNGIETQSCSAARAAVFEIEIANTGDRESSMELSLDNDFDTISATVSDEKIVLGSGEKKTVAVVVSPSFDTPQGEKEILLKITGKNFSFKEQMPLRFNVTSPGQLLAMAQLKIVSAPVQLTINAGEEKTVNFVVENISAVLAEEVLVRVRGLDRSQIDFGEKTIAGITGGEAVSVDLKLKAASKAVHRSYDLTVEFVSNNAAATVPLNLTVSGAKDTAKTAEKPVIPGILGLFSLTNPFGPQIDFLTIILIVAVGIILLFLLNSSNKNGFYGPVRHKNNFLGR